MAFMGNSPNCRFRWENQPSIARGLNPACAMFANVCLLEGSYENKDRHCASLDGPAGVGSSSHDGGST